MNTKYKNYENNSVIIYKDYGNCKVATKILQDGKIQDQLSMNL